MTYHELVEKARETFEYSDARAVFEHVAIQVNIIGEGSGAFYIEIAQRQVSVEPYDYYDRDGLITTTAENLILIVEGKLSFMEAVAEGKIQYSGDMEKLKLFEKVKIKRKGNKQTSGK